MQRFIFLFGLAFFTFGAAVAQAPTAQTLLEQGLAKATAEHKNVLLDFGASWCPWCRRFDELLKDPRFSRQFEQSYDVVHVTVVESDRFKANTNSGWDSLMLGFRKHKDQDIPYEVFLGPDGKPLADSFEHYGAPLPNNAGFPQTPEEIDAFLAQLRQTGKAFAPADLQALRAYFLAVHPTHH